MSDEKWALLSVSDKTGLIDFAVGLQKLGYKVASTGGTAKLLTSSGIQVKEVAALTESPEMLDGRVKSLHPRIHGGILFDRRNNGHCAEVARHHIPNFEIVVVNLYPFQHGSTIDEKNADRSIELIDIGGPAMLRGAAKNFQFVLPIIDPLDYGDVLKRLTNHELDFAFRRKMAAKTFAWISSYDRSIATSLDSESTSVETLEAKWTLKHKLRYGENPHQTAEVWLDQNSNTKQLHSLRCLQGKELSYNNLLDIEAAAQACQDLAGEFSAVVVKHTNPCGAAIGRLSQAETLKRAISSDPVSAFGGIIAVSSIVDRETAAIICQQFYECVVAPKFAPEALELLAQKKNLRAVEAPFIKGPPRSSKLIRTLFDGFLRQDSDSLEISSAHWRCVTKNTVDDHLRSQFLSAMRLVRHVKSNGIVIFSEDQAIGVGAGQMSRIDSTEIAIKKAIQHGHSIEGAVVGSDAFFPFRDCIDLLAKHKISGIIQPGGSMRDQESIDACNEHGITMVFTGMRHFRH